MQLGYLLATPVAGGGGTPNDPAVLLRRLRTCCPGLGQELHVPRANVLVSGDYYGVALSVGKDFASGKQLAEDRRRGGRLQGPDCRSGHLPAVRRLLTGYRYPDPLLGLEPEPVVFGRAEGFVEGIQVAHHLVAAELVR